MEQLNKRTDLVRGQHVYAPNYHIMLEPVYGCNRRCSFCACDFTQFHFMGEDVFEAILRNVTEETKRMTWNLCGEPTLHPRLIEMVRRAKQKSPKAVFDIITNGDVKVLKPNSLDYFEELIDAGMNFIHFDIYTNEGLEQAEAFRKTFNQAKYDYVSFEESASGFWGQHASRPRITFMGACFGLNRPNKTNIKFNTQAGCTPYATWEENGVDGKQFPLRKSCKEVLKYATIGWDGRYVLCCADHGRPTDYGNILTTTIEAYQTSLRRRMAQVALDAGRRDLVPSCYYCNKLSFRDGLWPYPWIESFKVSDIRKELFGASRLSPKMYNNFTKIKDDIGFNSADIQSLYDKGAAE